MMSQLLIHMDNLVHRSLGRMEQLSTHGTHILYIQMFVVGVAIGNIFIFDTSLDVYIALFCVFLSIFGLYCQKRITKHMTSITDSLDNITVLLDPRKFMNPDLVVDQVKIFKRRIELPLFTIIFKVF
jgi:hypothetical protein